jgi:hypothetical protein
MRGKNEVWTLIPSSIQAMSPASETLGTGYKVVLLLFHVLVNHVLLDVHNVLALPALDRVKVLEGGNDVLRLDPGSQLPIKLEIRLFVVIFS